MGLAMTGKVGPGGGVKTSGLMVFLYRVTAAYQTLLLGGLVG